MLPTIWGNYAWYFIHMVPMDYPEHPTETDKRNYYNFFNSLQHVLPCFNCRKNLSQHLKKYQLTDEALSSRKNLIKWTVDLHNIVNYYTGKPMLTYAEANNELNKISKPKKSLYCDFLYYLLIIIALLILGYLIYYYVVKHKKLNN